jgi:GDPmannose 4,6-dehydratase
VSGPRALITGITGQDGSFLAELLLEKGYEVFGMVRRLSSENHERLEPFRDRITLHTGDLLDQSSLVDVMRRSRPTEIYNLAAMSFVAASWNQPTLTAEFTGLGVARMLEAMREACPDARFYQASSSEMFGKVRSFPQNELTPFYPRSPYGVAKTYGHFITVNYRESYGLHATSGILFNHESERRGLEFVTRKVAHGAAAIKLGLADQLALGNLDARRDWGYAPDYVEAMWMMLQQDEPEDFVIATGVQASVREFIEKSAARLGITLAWRGSGPEEEGVVVAVEGDSAPALKGGETIVRVDPRYFRPAEVEALLGDATKAREQLGWTPQITLDEMIDEMVAHDLDHARRHALLRQHGYSIPVAQER